MKENPLHILLYNSSLFLRQKKIKIQNLNIIPYLSIYLYKCYLFNFTDGGGGMLTPPDKLNGDHHNPHWASSSLTMAGSMQTPPSSPPMSIERFG